jgi:hypothetical protein
MSDYISETLDVPYKPQHSTCQLLRNILKYSRILSKLNGIYISQ